MYNNLFNFVPFRVSKQKQIYSNKLKSTYEYHRSFLQIFPNTKINTCT